MHKNPIFKWIETAGGLRDGLIVLVTITYITGYVAWSYIAWSNGFGSLPVLDAQYFLAGLPLILTAILVIIIIRYLRSIFLVKWPTWILSLTLKKQIILHICIFVMPLCSLALLVSVDVFNWPTEDANRIIAIVVAFVLIVLFYLLFEPKSILEKSFEMIEEKIQSITIQKYKPIVRKAINLSYNFLVGNKKVSYIYTIPIIAGIVAIYLYLNFLYPQIPYEFGGGRPRKAQLDLVKSDFSKETISQLVENILLTEKTKILNSKEVTVYLATKDLLLIRTEGTEKALNKTFELPRNSIKTVYWTDKDSMN